MAQKFKIAVNTGGGDAPGLNAVIRAVTLAAHRRGWEVYGIKGSYYGLLDTDEIVKLTPELVENITAIGGTILGTTNKGNPFEYPINFAGMTEIKDVSDTIVENFKKFQFNCLVAIGGDGSLGIAHRLSQKGIPVVGVPKTIDNDLEATVITFGFDTAVSTATEAIDKLHSTAEAHERIMVVEVMGRYAGWIALNSGLSGCADIILLPEVPFDLDVICQRLGEMELERKRSAIIVVAEGAKPKDGGLIHKGEGEAGRQEVVLGGVADYIAKEIAKRTKRDTRSLVLGHLQRGGTPTTFDRLVALRFGAAAVRAIEAGKFGTMVALAPPTVKLVPIEEAISKMKSVPLDCDSILTARDLGVCLGDKY